MKITTITRKEIDVFDPRPENICLVDIAWALSRVPRFAGHTESPMTVLEHTLEVVTLLPWEYSGQTDLARWALLHDAAEAYIGDVPKPIKDQIPAFTEVENKILDVIWRKYMPEGVNRAVVETLVHEADMKSLTRQCESRWAPSGPVTRGRVEARKTWLCAVIQGLSAVDLEWEVAQRPALFGK